MAPQISGIAVRATASSGNFTRAEITTPTDHDTELTSAAINPRVVEPCAVRSGPIRIPTPARPAINPSPLSQCGLCWPIAHPISRMNMGSVAISNAAKPDATPDFSAQCSSPCPMAKNNNPTMKPETQCSRRGR